jgi:hypothetical protein
MTERDSPSDTFDRPVTGPWSYLSGCMIALWVRPPRENRVT